MAAPRKSGDEQAKEVVTFIMRIPPHLQARIDAALANRSVRIPRHTWVTEAIAEKLEREESRT